MTATTPPSFEDFLAALPKVELHVHLEGSMQPATLLALADKHQISTSRSQYGLKAPV